MIVLDVHCECTVNICLPKAVWETCSGRVRCELIRGFALVVELVVWNCGSFKLFWFHGVVLEYDFCMNVPIFGIVQYRYCVLQPGSWGICSCQDCPWHCLASGKQVTGFIYYSLPLPMKQSSTVACMPGDYYTFFKRVWCTIIIQF